MTLAHSIHCVFVGEDGETKYLSDLGLSVRPVPKSTVYVYSGKGCSEQSLHMLYTSLKMFVDTSKYSVKKIGPVDLIEGRWRFRMFGWSLVNEERGLLPFLSYCDHGIHVQL
jgi:hypothetical protein